MKNFLVKVKNWFIAHKPTKRRLIQLYAALLTNANVKGFFTGEIYTGTTKNLCVPGLNCYSCPGAIGACPLGALQDSLAQSQKTVPAYIFGILILFGLLLGRMICGFLCPFGLIQELLYKIRTPKLRKNRFTRILSYFKYVMLGIVIAIPLIYSGIPVFCKYICPAGTLEGALALLANPNNSSFFSMLGYLFTWKFCVLVAVIVASIFIYRFLCRFLCPLGAIYSLFCKVSLLGVKLDKDKCINCGLCIEGCKMDIKHVGDHECIHCGECIPVCPVQAITWKGSKIFLKNTSPSAQPVPETGEKVALLSLAKANGSATLYAPAENSTAEAAESVKSRSVDSENANESEAAVAPTEGEAAEAAATTPTFGARAKAAFRTPKFVVQLIAWVLALAVLITAWACYGVTETKEKVTKFTLQTVVGDEEEYTLAYNDDKVKLCYFWRTDFEESVTGMQEIISAKTTFGDRVEVLAIHSIYKDDRNVAEFINAQEGWDSSGIIFLQDDMEANVYSSYGGDTSVPAVITVVLGADGTLVSTAETAMSAEEVCTQLAKAQSYGTYYVGDLCPIFELTTYSSASEKTEFSTYNISKVTVINFWYTDCDPCKDELYYFEDTYRKYADKIDMYAVHSATALPNEGEAGVQSFIDETYDKSGLNRKYSEYTLCFAQDTEEVNAFTMLGGTFMYPMTVVLNAKGVITFWQESSCSESALVAAIEEALA